MAKKTTADQAEAGAAAPASTTETAVHTYAQEAQPAKPAKPAHHLPTPRRPRDQYTGVAGTYTRDPETGERTPVKPEAEPAPGDDTPAAA